MSDYNEITAIITAEEPAVAATLDELRFLVLQGKAGKAPRVNNETGHWETYDNDAQDWADTGTKAQGDKGDPGTPGVSPTVQTSTITGGHRVTITDAEHPQGQSFDVMDGDPGDDYVLTPQDKQEIADQAAALVHVSAESIGITTSDETGVKNSEALNAYIADSSAAKTVHFKSGNYKFSNTVNITTSTNFAGDGKGTVLEFTGDGIFLNSTVYFAPNFYNMTIKGPGNGLGLKIGDKSISKSSCRGFMFNVHMGYFDVAIEVNYGWGWLFLQLGAQNINDWLFHVTGVWNTSNVIGGEYEYQSGGGVFWDANSGSNDVNFIGIIWESLNSHVFKVADNAANISVNIEGAYFENSKEYNDQVSTAHLIYSNNPNAVFNFVGETSVGYYQVIKSAGLVKNPPEKALLALGGCRQPFVNPYAKICAVQSPDYQIHHGMVFDLEGKTFYTRPDKYDGSTSVFPVDGLGINFTAYNASWVAYKNQFDASTPVRQMVLRLPDGAFDLANVNVGFEFVVPSNFDWSTVASGIININGVTDGSSHLTAFDRYLKMLGTDVTESYDRYQHFRYFRNAEVSSPTVALGGKNYYELQIAVPSAEVIITKVIIDDGKQIFATNKLIDAITSGEKQVFETIDQSGSIDVSLNGGITNLVLHGKTSTATGKNLCSLDTATWTGVKEFACDPIPAGDYYFSGHFEGGNPDATAYAVMFYDENNNRLITKTTPNNADRIGFPVSFSAPCAKIAFYAGSGWPGSQGFTATWSDLQIEPGSTPTSYEPYGATGDIGISPIVRLGNKTLSAVGVSQLFDGDSFDFVNCAYYKASDNTTTPAAINGSVNKVVGDVAVSAGGDVFVGYVTDQQGGAL